MPTQEEVYAQHGRQYEALVSREDYRGNILQALREIVDFEGLDVIDLGAGTGRLTGLLAPRAARVLAFDASTHMLGIARDELRRAPRSNWLAAAADHSYLPLPATCADLAVSGWSVSYLAVWNPAGWREELERWLGEMRRLLRPAGRVILLESLGTGNEAPQPLVHLKDFYPWLDENGFGKTWIRTDYRFDSLQEAEELSEFFFGPEMKNRLVIGEHPTLPECTSLWWREF
jgi:SAM-dependent methyltransferase